MSRKHRNPVIWEQNVPLALTPPKGNSVVLDKWVKQLKQDMQGGENTLARGTRGQSQEENPGWTAGLNLTALSWPVHHRGLLEARIPLDCVPSAGPVLLQARTGRDLQAYMIREDLVLSLCHQW